MHRNKYLSGFLLLRILFFSILFTQCDPNRVEKIKLKGEEVSEVGDEDNSPKQRVEEMREPSILTIANYPAEAASCNVAMRAQVKQETSTAPTLRFEKLPEAALCNILSRITPKDMNTVRSIYRFFYRYTTGYLRPGIVGLLDKPRNATADFGMNNKMIDFALGEAKNLKPENTLRVPFDRLVGKVQNMPKEFWPYIAGSKIETADFCNSMENYFKGKNEINDEWVTELANYLPGSNIRILNLSKSVIGDTGAIALGKILPHTKIEELCIDTQDITVEGAIGLIKGLVANLPDGKKITCKLRVIRLHNNKVMYGGSAADFAKSFEGTNIEVIDLSTRSSIHGTAEWSIDFAKSLQATKVRTLILQDIEFGNSDPILLAKSFQNLYTLSLYGLDWNNNWAIDFANHLPNSVTTVDLYVPYEGDDLGDLRSALKEIINKRRPDVKLTIYGDVDKTSYSLFH